MDQLASDFSYLLRLYCPLPRDRQRQLRLTASLDQADWQPLRECAAWSDLLCGGSPPFYLNTDHAQIRPLWDAELGCPHVASIQVCYPAGGRPSQGITASVSYFDEVAQLLAAELNRQQLAEEGQLLDFEVIASPRSGQPAAGTSAAPSPPLGGPGGHDTITIDTITTELPVRRLSFDRLLAASRNRGTTRRSEAAVFVDPSVLDEAEAASLATPRLEVAGLLIGHIGWDPARRHLFLVITGQLPAAATEQTMTSVRFTPDTWSQAEDALAHRGRDEILLGWWHSHPARYWQETIGPSASNDDRSAAERPLDGRFLSADDRVLHRCCFARAYSVAVVVSNSAQTGITMPMFGWHRGSLVSREYHLLSQSLHLLTGDPNHV